jgi:hypothetical protein
MTIDKTRTLHFSQPLMSKNHLLEILQIEANPHRSIDFIMRNREQSFTKKRLDIKLILHTMRVKVDERVISASEDVVSFAWSSTQDADEVLLFSDDLEQACHHLELWFFVTDADDDDEQTGLGFVKGWPGFLGKLCLLV